MANQRPKHELLLSVTKLANRDDAVHAIVLAGVGSAFCRGYDLIESAAAGGEQAGSQLGGDAAAPWDPMLDFYGMNQFTQHLMSLRHSYKSTIAKVNGPTIAGGSDIALCRDLV